MLAIDPRSFKPNGHEDIIAAAKLRASKKPKVLPGQNGKRGKWAQNVIELASEVCPKADHTSDQIKENYVTTCSAENSVIELLSDDDEKIELVDENKVFSVKVKKEEIPKCWIEVYLQMPKSHGNDVAYHEAPQSSTSDNNTIKNESKIEKGISSQRNFRNKKEKKGEFSAEKLESECPSIIDKEIVPDFKKDENLHNVVKILEESDVRTEGRYVQIDLYNGGPKVGSIIDKPKNIENSIRCRRPVSYVIAVNESGLLIDVTNRYSSCLSNTQKFRPTDIQWWINFIRDIEISSTQYSNNKNKNKESVCKIGISDCDVAHNHQKEESETVLNNGNKKEFEINVENEINRERIIRKEKTRLSQQLLAEQEEFKSDALREPLPTTVSGFKNNSLYVLERDIKVRARMIYAIYI